MSEPKIDEAILIKAKQAENALVKYQNYKIQTVEDFQEAGELVKKAVAKRKELEEAQSKMTKPINESKKAVMDFFRKPLNALRSVENIFRSSILNYTKEQARQERQAQLKREEEARKKQLEEKGRLEKMEVKAEKRGDKEYAEELEDQSKIAFVPPPEPVAPPAPKVEGIGTKKFWTFRIINRGIIPKQYLLVNEKLLKATAETTQGTLEVPGVVFYQDTTVTVRS